ncbi:universal stress protein [Photobacterium rosenbergii]|uniref:Universal stress protein n=1 Tax=Photobacterium rosenbergii TaxID=294936 RepID=A0ABU3ZDY7_9GAMM|nr:universal stress protein [Photobacterium rosenbergii]MDV5168314.1 universal stress protein [Photobacterium rosenbergii]
MSFRHLLLPVAPDQPLGDAFQEVLQIADSQSAKVTLVSVIEKLDELKEIARYSSKVMGLLDEATKTSRQTLEGHVQLLKAKYPKITFSVLVRLGIPFVEIIKAADELQASMIVIDTHRQNKTEACQRGSTTRHLMRKSALPIWSSNSHQSPISRVAVAVDVSSEEQLAFNEKILSLALEVCASTGAELTLLHAWHVDLKGFFRKWGNYRDLDIDLISKEMRLDRAERLKSLLAQHTDSPVRQQIKLLEGDAKEAIPRMVKEKSIDMVIMGSQSRSGIAGFLMGNTAESMLDKLTCSVLTLKPDAFHSPVLDQK